MKSNAKITCNTYGKKVKHYLPIGSEYYTVAWYFFSLATLFILFLTIHSISQLQAHPNLFNRWLDLRFHRSPDLAYALALSLLFACWLFGFWLYKLMHIAMKGFAIYERGFAQKIFWVGRLHKWEDVRSIAVKNCNNLASKFNPMQFEITFNDPKTKTLSAYGFRAGRSLHLMFHLKSAQYGFILSDITNCMPNTHSHDTTSQHG